MFDSLLARRLHICQPTPRRGVQRRGRANRLFQNSRIIILCLITFCNSIQSGLKFDLGYIYIYMLWDSLMADLAIRSILDRAARFST